tara:strand:- start:2492 stop:3364 length:873 start_codon:yes stop_codon:yes gene_type:complete
MIFFFLFLLINICYIHVWYKFLDKVPTGIGIVLIVPCYFLYFEEQLYFLSTFLILTFTFIYFLDDLKGIHFLWRIMLQILSSVVIFFSVSFDGNYIFLILNLFFILVLVNVLNFQDGEDLNISTLLIMIFGVFYFYADLEFIKKTSQIILLFLISFSFFNFKKNFLYFGDSGCYLISIIIALFAYSEMNNAILIKLLISVIIFPVIDVFYVIGYRILNKENLLTRNYLHIYQIIAQKINSKLYLLPNMILSFLNIFISFYIPLGINFIIFLVSVNISLLFIMRLIIKKSD